MATDRRSLKKEIRCILETFEESLGDACSKLSEVGDELSGRENPDFDQDQFWTNLVGVAQLISHEATKLCLAFDGNNMPSTCEACKALVDKAASTCLDLLTVFFILPKSRGKSLHREIRVNVLSILQGMKSLAAAIKERRRGELQNVGDVWEHCEAVAALPRDNLGAVRKILHEQHDMVQDASQELMDALQNEDGLGGEVDATEFDPPVSSWNASDRNVLLPSSGLVKACKACIKKTLQAATERGNGVEETAIPELDAIADIVNNSSSLVDELVLSVYPPMNHSAVRNNALEVHKNCKQLLSTVKASHFFDESLDGKWTEFLERAADHNWVKISDLVLAD